MHVSLRKLFFGTDKDLIWDIIDRADYDIRDFDRDGFGLSVPIMYPEEDVGYELIFLFDINGKLYKINIEEINPSGRFTQELP